MLDLSGAGLNSLLQSRGECSASHELLFQPGRQAILFGESWGQMILVLHIPLMEGVRIVAIVIALTLIVVISVFVVALSVPFSIALGHRGARRQQEYSQHAGGHPFRCFHSYAPQSG